MSQTIFSESLKTLPTLGVGLGLRYPLLEDTLTARDKIDWVEIIPENYLNRGGIHLETLERTQDADFSIISHGVGLSVGSVDPLNETYISHLKALFKQIDPPWFSDHLCFSSVDNVHLHDLLPLPFTYEALDHIVKRIRTIQETFERPFCIENISYYTQYPHGELTEAQFISEILERADCGMLLDVNNVYVNAQNHHEDPVAFLDNIPLERVVQIHIAGHDSEDELVIDTHGDAICQPVYDLLETVLEQPNAIRAILLERDTNIPPMAELLDELAEIRAICARTQTFQSAQPQLAGVSS